MKHIKIDIISDVMCPWCIMGYKNLESAINELEAEEKVEIKWHPFELNPQISPEGEEFKSHLMKKYGFPIEQVEQSIKSMRRLGDKAGFTYNFFDGFKMVNSRDAHILIDYAAEEGKQTEMKLRLFSAHFTEEKDISKRELLIDEAETIGLDSSELERRLDSDEYRKKIADEEFKIQQSGIYSVPTMVINNEKTLSGSQSIENYKQVLKEMLN